MRQGVSPSVSVFTKKKISEVSGEYPGEKSHIIPIWDSFSGRYVSVT